MSLQRRSCGILLHPTSLSGPHGSGDIGPAARSFADFLVKAGQSWWQMLPIVPPTYGPSPYQAVSTFAGNPLLISPEGLVESGWLQPEDIIPPFPISFDGAWECRMLLLRKAFEGFRPGRDFDSFIQAHGSWLEDYALFQALKKHYNGAGWIKWPAPVRSRQPAALEQVREELREEVAFHRFVQYVFDRQWHAFKQYCHDRGLRLIGDVPIYVSHDSADVWSHPELFFLDESGKSSLVAGTPPDAFSTTGQLWGNPLYRWETHRETGFAWWVQRMAHAFQQFDAIRLDHFIGFERFWAIPAGAKTAMEGEWQPGPSDAIFHALAAALGDVDVIAEDLGLVTQAVRDLRDRFAFPGMKILQFAFGDPLGPHEYLPHNYPNRCVAYTGTHDNDTVVGWYQQIPGYEKARVADYLGHGVHEIHWDLIRLAYQSVANLAIIPVQDFLGLGGEARMNTPGTASGNWAWRLEGHELTEDLGKRIHHLATIFGRAPSEPNG